MSPNWLLMLVLATPMLAVPMLVEADSCPVSLPNLPDPPDALPSSSTHAWFGSHALAALIPNNGHWQGMGPAKNFGDKFWWWRQGYRARTESLPDLVVTAHPLDAPDERIFAQPASNAFGDRWDLMLVGMEFPAPGCWIVTGSYRGVELSAVLAVGDDSGLAAVPAQ